MTVSDTNQPAIWQEYDCPDCMIDFDLFEDELLAVGEQCYCSACGGYHKAGDGEVINQTCVVNAAGELSYRGIPADAEEKARWIREVLGK